MKILSRSALIVFGLVIFLFAFALIFREPSAGGYRFVADYEQHGETVAEGRLAEVSPWLPVITLYGAHGAKRMRLLLLPGVKLAVPLTHPAPALRDAFIVRYDVAEDGLMTFSAVFGKRLTRLMFPLTQEETAARREKWHDQHDLRTEQMRQLAATPATQTGWVSSLGNGAMTLVMPPDYVHRRGILEPIDVNQDSYIKFQRVMGQPFASVEEQFSKRFDAFTHTEDGIFIAKTGDDSFTLQAIRTIDDSRWTMIATANDFESAVKHIAIIRSLRDDGKPWRIVGDKQDYLTSPVLRRFPTYQDQANAAFGDWLALMLKPMSVVLEEPFTQRSLTPEVENDAGAKLYNAFSIGLSLSAEDRIANADDGALLAVSADQPVHIETLPGSDGELPVCLAKGVFPLLPATGDRQLGVEISVMSASLPDCRLAAEVMVNFGRTDFTADLDLEATARFSDHFATFDDARLDDNGFMILRQGKAGAVLRITGETIVPFRQNTHFSFLNDDVLSGTSNAPGRPGVTVYRPDGRLVAELDYDALYNVSNPKGVWRDIFQAAKGDKVGLYDLKHQREIAARRYDRFSVLPQWDLVLARRGDIVDFIRPDGTELVPGGVSAYVFADPMRGAPPEDDFIAVKSLAEGNWRFLTRKDIPLLEGRFADVRNLPRPIAREFELTTMDGEKRYITLTDDGKVEAIGAPQ